MVLGLNELAVLRRKYRHLQRGDARPIQGEKHPLLAYQDAKAMSPKVSPGLRRNRSMDRWAGPSLLTREKIEEKQWRENCELLERMMKR